MLVAALAWTIAPYTSLMPVYAKDIFGGGPHTLGYLLSAAGLGALVSTAYLAGRATVRGLGRVIMFAAATSGVALAAFAYMRIYPIALLLMVLVGGGTILAAASANTILQTIVDDRLRGRVASFYTLAFLGVAPLGNLAAGAIAGRWHAVHVRAERRAGGARRAVVSRAGCRWCATCCGRSTSSSACRRARALTGSVQRSTERQSPTDCSARVRRAASSAT